MEFQTVGRDQKIKLIEEISFEEFTSEVNSYFSSFYFVSVFGGNISKEQSISLIEKMNKTLNQTPNDIRSCQGIPVLVIPNKHDLMKFTVNSNDKASTSLFSCFCQYGIFKSVEEKVYLELLTMLL